MQGVLINVWLCCTSHQWFCRAPHKISASDLLNIYDVFYAIYFMKAKMWYSTFLKVLKKMNSNATNPYITYTLCAYLFPIGVENEKALSKYRVKVWSTWSTSLISLYI